MAKPSLPVTRRRVETRSQSKGLCEWCRTLDLDFIFRQPHKTSLGNLVRQSGPSSGPSTDSCPLCSLLVRTYGKGTRKYRRGYDELRSFSSARISKRGWDSVNTVMLSRTNNSAYPFLVPQVKGAETVRILLPLLASHDLFAQWLRYCRQHHTTLCALPEDSTPRSIPSFWVIDCQADRLVPWSGQPYITLSYVWGAGSVAPPFSAILPKTKPQTIQDAIVTTLALGLRYLWIDRYCIDQGNPSEVAGQVSKMDLIYRCSEVTLVAAAGQDTEHGLPGVSRPRSSLPQPHAKVGKYHLVSSLPDPAAGIRSSKWWTRGWTYQEGILARRRLVFSDEQVYFECGGMYCYEALNFDLDALHTRDGQHFKACYYRGVTVSPLFPPPQRLGTDRFEITEIIGEYSKRTLGKEEDVLNGLRGVLGAMESGKIGLRHLFGVPLIGRAPRPTAYEMGEGSAREGRKVYNSLKWSPVIGFCLGLCWQTDRPLARREGFPTWSWAGWKSPDSNDGWRSGPVRWLFDKSEWRCLQGSVDLQLRVQVRDDGRILDWDDFEQDYSTLNSQLAGTLHLSGWAVNAHVVGCKFAQECTVSLEGEGGPLHRWTFPLTALDFKEEPSAPCLLIPLADMVEGYPRTSVLVVAQVRPGMYRRIGAGKWWNPPSALSVLRTWHEFQLE